ncbi:MAG TPA: DUF3842 family protein [Candidatus Limiplasma sp.]|nr:DUF3842 family protein [Candidatus Limiplasma sp.]HPS81431.1 DUF3842 family protein [Candidatus Limiplasma sp.]
MKILVIDGQGGGIGKALVTAIKQLAPALPITALGTNAAATSAMLRAGADEGATGENAIRYQCRHADIIVGVIGILHANALLGEISPAIASAISGSEAEKVLIPLERCGLHVAGAGRQTLEEKLSEAAATVVKLARGPTRADHPTPG